MKKILILTSIFLAISISNIHAQDVIISEKTAAKIESVKAKGEKQKANLDKKLEKDIEKIRKKAEKDIEKAKAKNESEKVKTDAKTQQEIEKIRIQENISLM